MPFRATFDCLWCGSPHATRTPDDVEGWAQLCPDCLGRAQENGFLRSRLRTALAERSRAAGRSGDPAADDVGTAAHTTASADPAPAAYDDWYLRRGASSGGPLLDLPWQMELDEVTRWLDGLPLAGVIVELAAGSGWWSTLLAEKGELWVYETDADLLDAARRRLVAHGLRAHLHERDPLVEPERHVDVVFGAHLLGRALDPEGRAAQLEIVRGWLRPGGTFVAVETRADVLATDRVDAWGEATVPGPGRAIRPTTRPALRTALERGGFGPIDVRETSRAFLMARAVAP